MKKVTYMLKGAFRHEDNKGHAGTIGPGDLQWMTAGRGIIHSEMPAADGDNVGLQLWVNLAAKYKMSKPQYQGKLQFYPHLLRNVTCDLFDLALNADEISTWLNER